MSTVLAIDPGYGRCGVAVLSNDSGKPCVLYASCIETSGEQAFGDRLGTVLDSIEAMLKIYKPDTIAIEEIFFSKNQKTAMAVAAVRGALLYLAHRAHLPVAEYNPQNIKVAITGDGRADKTQVLAMLPRLVVLPNPHARDDEYDAIALGLTHLATKRINNLP